MSETANLIHDAAHRLFAQHVTVDVLNAAEKGVWPEALWDAVEEAGFLDTLADSDAAPAERATNTAILLRAAGRHLAPIPLGETIVARALLSARKLKLPRGPMSFGVLDGRTHTHGDHAHLEGRALRVPYGRHAANVLLSASGSGEAVLIAVRRGKLGEGANIAGEPRDDLVFGDTAGATVSAISGDDLVAYGAAVRAAQMGGALERILMQTVEYARTRVQFGKPIAAFQAIQQQLAVLAGHVAATGIAADAAFAGIEDPKQRSRAAAIAKIRAGEAAGAATSIAHQVHGAIGITKEHSLHFATRRLWSWRAEFGAEAYWAERLGRAVCAAGAEAYWPEVTR
jgi:alkylation response protein AidB-like acyl-CoA dehydrogenase